MRTFRKFYGGVRTNNEKKTSTHHNCTSKEIQFYVNIFLTYLCSCFFHYIPLFHCFYYRISSTHCFAILAPSSTISLFYYISFTLSKPLFLPSSIPLLYTSPLYLFPYISPLYLSSISLLYLSLLYLFLYFYYIFPSSSLSYLVNSYFRGPRPKPTIPIQFGRVCTSCYHTPCET